jgi:hypothetical protein
VVALTIGMATYKDFDGVYFTLQALRLYQDMADTELLVIDNYGCEDTRQLVEGWVHGRYVLATAVGGTAAPRDLVFREARGAAVLCCDSHVLFAPGAVARLKAYYRDHPDCRDLLQGPLVYDDLQNLSTHFAPEWRAEMWGTWATDPRGLDPEGDPFEIPMQGLGAFSCRKEAWPGFNPRFRGFGGEEGYIHEKFRRAGGRCLCLPWFRWLHRFGRPAGVPYPLTVEDKLRNYVIGHAELGLDLTPVLEHFAEWLPQGRVAAIAEEALGGAARPDAPPDPPPAVVADAGPGARAPADAANEEAPPAPRAAAIGDHPSGRRAIVCYVDDNRHLVQQALALRHSWLYARSPDTDLVMMGPAGVLAGLPDDVVKIEQRSVQDDPQWRGYPYANAIICMNGAGAERLDRYTHVLRTDVDTFITPAWNDFRPATFVFGTGAYANDEDVKRRLREIAARHGLVHRGLTNIGSTWYGPTEVVRRTSAFTEMLLKDILARCFADHRGAWPGWYWGVSLLYAGEIAVNHCVPDAQWSDSLDASNTATGPSARFAHIHCWHTDDKFSKHAFMDGKYTREDARNLDLDIAADYCMAMSFRSLHDLLRNDLISHAERGLDLQPLLKRAAAYLPQEAIAAIALDALWGPGAGTLVQRH